MERNAHNVTVGQVWKDNDPRTQGNPGSQGRLLRIVEVDLGQGRAKCELATDRKKGGKRFVHVRLDRFNGTKRGYSLIKDQA